MLTLTELNECFIEAIEKGSQFIAVEINIGLSRAEVVINHRMNFEEKRAYYNHAYDEMLFHRFSGDENIRIVGFAHGYSIAEACSQLGIEQKAKYNSFLN